MTSERPVKLYLEVNVLIDLLRTNAVFSGTVSPNALNCGSEQMDTQMRTTHIPMNTATPMTAGKRLNPSPNNAMVCKAEV